MESKIRGRNAYIRNLVNYCVPLIGGSVCWPFYDIASPNLAGRYYITMATEPVINISQNKAAAVSHLIVGISAVLMRTKLKFVMKMLLHPTISSVSGC